MTTLTPRLGSGERIKIWVSEDDSDKVTRGLGYKGRVTDLRTGTSYDIYGADCGAGRCECDAIAVPVSTR